MNSPSFRIERDSMGELRVPAEALWGAQTQRAVENFPVSGLRLPRGFIRALALIKSVAAGVNGHLGAIDPSLASAIEAAAERGGPVVYAPKFWLPIMLIIRHMPTFVFNKLNL